MGRTENKKEPESGVILLAKQFGRTSFASLSSVKRALGTGKVGHTGTLDSFADGLLVVLSGRLTRLVPHITGFDKTYLALVEFGSETDTLDPTGKIVVSGGLVPSRADVEAVIPEFVGEIEQVPPLFSALHIGGKRASDIARDGKTVEMPARKITIYSIKIVDFMDKYALLEVRCSKGTYIRSLARDIAVRCGTCAHLAALRRTAVGPFSLSDAAGFSALDEFTIPSLLEHPRGGAERRMDEKSEESLRKEILGGMKGMEPSLAEYCGMFPVEISPYFVDSYSNGRPLNARVMDAFFRAAGTRASSGMTAGADAELAVFYPKGAFGGVIEKRGGKFSYGFVVPPRRDFVVYSWDDIVGGKFSADFRSRGTSLTIGSFDGPHIGHDALFASALSKRADGLVPGVVTFTKSLRALKNPAVYPGDIASLPQKLGVLASEGFRFAIVIDFSPDFARIEGIDFLRSLVELCGMRHLSEGKDFHCGYNGSTDMAMISGFCRDGGFSLSTIDSVLYQGQRVSSSRVRECILGADFASVRFMLERPFALDCTGFEWSESRGGGQVCLSARKSGIQMLPPDGRYDVVAVVAVGDGRKSQKQEESGVKQPSANVRAYRSDCMLEDGILRLSFSDKLIGGCVLAVQFGCPDENIF